MTNGTIQFNVLVALSYDTGTKEIPCWIVDNAGIQSNTVSVTFTQLWTRQFGTILEDIGEGIAIDSNNNIYVTGSTTGDLAGNINSGGADVFLTKFTNAGMQEWTTLLGSANDADIFYRGDEGMSIAVDGNDNIYVTGFTNGDNFDGIVTPGGGSDAFLSKFDSDGNKAWTKILGTTSPDTAYGITIYGTAIYITGKTSGDLDGNINAGGVDAFIVKYDTSGNKLWTKLLGTTRNDSGKQVAVDTNGYIYLMGSTDGVLGIDPSPDYPAGDADLFVAKYDDAGNKQWVTQIGTYCADLGGSVAADSIGNIYLTGKVYLCAYPGNVANGWYDALLAKVESSGTLSWVKQFGTASNDKALAVTVDTNDNIYVTGYLDSGDFTGDNEGSKIFVNKYDGSGNNIWSVQESAGYSWGNQGRAITTDNSNNIFVTGTVHGSIDGHTNPNVGEDEVFILKFDPNGVRQ